MIITIGNHKYQIKSASSTIVCNGCAFFNADCPCLEDGVQLCKVISTSEENTSSRIIFKRLPSFTEDIISLIKSMDHTAQDKDVLIHFLIDADDLQSVFTIAKRHGVIK